MTAWCASFVMRLRSVDWHAFKHFLVHVIQLLWPSITFRYAVLSRPEYATLVNRHRAGLADVPISVLGSALALCVPPGAAAGTRCFFYWLLVRSGRLNLSARRRIVLQPGERQTKWCSGGSGSDSCGCRGSDVAQLYGSDVLYGWWAIWLRCGVIQVIRISGDLTHYCAAGRWTSLHR